MLALAAGFGGAVQIAVQSRLGDRVGSLEAVATASLIGAVIALTVLLLARRSLAGVGDAFGAPKWMLLGGVMSALIILAITVAGPRIGIVATSAVLIAAQFTLATVIDRNGWFGVERIAVTWPRLARHRAPVRGCRADAAEMSVLEGLEPAGVWDRFAELTRIPRPPKQEAEARAHVLAWAAERGFETAVDAEGNVVVRVPATDGRERAPTVVLQAHLDMVCERDPDSPYDPRDGRINVVVDGDWIVAEGTTLGADNGIGVAGAMAVAADAKVLHGPLELLFTVSEEQGLDGAKALDPSLVSGRLLLNLDGTSDESLTVGCAGSTHTFTRLPLPLEPVPDDYVMLEVTVSGARGGHSGGDIAKGRVNANKALGRVLAANAAPPGTARRRREPERTSARRASGRRSPRRGRRFARAPSPRSPRYGRSTQAPTTASRSRSSRPNAKTPPTRRRAPVRSTCWRRSRAGWLP